MGPHAVAVAADVDDVAVVQQAVDQGRRRIPVATLAERASVSRTTLNKVEKGEPGVSLGIYATVLFVLGMIDRLADIADPRHDSVGLELEEEYLPERIRLPRPGKPKGEA